mgnify:CR=1 FL=1
MKCPYCNEEMEKGVIENPYEISWRTKRYYIPSARFYKGTVILADNTWAKWAAAAAFLCRNCEKVIIDYKDNQCDLNKK